MHLLIVLSFFASFVFSLDLAADQLVLSAPHSSIEPTDEPLISTSKYSVKTPPLDTPWTYEVGTNPWPQYPRPKLVRPQWKNLNGIWQYARASDKGDLSIPPFNQTLPQEVLVPFCLESGLSGIQEENTIYSWYRTTFTVPSDWTGDRVILHFGAVDYEATIFVNERTAFFHRGGYSAFSVDVTKYLQEGDNELLVFIWDPTDSLPYVIPLGKQTLHPSHIFYRPCSGIWQTVWLESVPANYITDLSMSAAASGQLNLTVHSAVSDNATVKVAIYDRATNESVATHSGTANSPLILHVSSPKNWTPDSPDLYDIEITMGHDTITSYTGFRTVTKEKVDGVQRIVLNGDVIFPFGTLDQGYWPDGVYTPPTYEAMTFDIKQLKLLGYNMLRKHVKVEPALYYSAADELGILIFQDMPSQSLGRAINQVQQTEFQRQFEIMVEQLKSYTSIIAWVIYNEGWAQPESSEAEYALTDLVRKLDPTRLVNTVSGWRDHDAGDFSDTHHYPTPECGVPWHDGHHPFDPSRIGFLGEFGGSGHNVSAEHLWKVKHAVDEINQTYEMWDTLDAWNRRGRYMLSMLRSQVELYSCAGAVWTQTTDVEGEVNGMMTYDRRILRADIAQWRKDIQALYDASSQRAVSANRSALGA